MSSTLIDGLRLLDEWDKHYTAGSTVWRYMDQRKFRDLMTTRQLYFTRLDLLDDPDEHNLVLASNSRDADAAETVYVNCWHLNNEESLTMWRQYARKNGVVIKSTKEKVQLALRRLMFSYTPFHYTANGAVRYRTDEEMADFLRMSGERIDNFVPALNKRRSYEHEQEFRLAISLQGASRPESHVRLPVDLNYLVDAIHIGDDTELQGVQDSADQAGLRIAVQRSLIVP